jgi:hypothetical protein
MTHDQLLHFSAHFGMSYFLYSYFYSRARTTKLIAFVLSLGIGLGYKILEGSFDSLAVSMFYNLIGVVSAVYINKL